MGSVVQQRMRNAYFAFSNAGELPERSADSAGAVIRDYIARAPCTVVVSPDPAWTQTSVEEYTTEKKPADAKKA